MKHCAPIKRLVSLQFQKLYPEIYRQRFPSSGRESSKPKIKPPLLSIKKSKAFGIRN